MNTPQSPSPLSPELERGLERLREFCAAWPKLAEHINGFHINNGIVKASWNYGHDLTHEEVQAIARECKDAGKWKREPCGSAFHYVVSVAGLTLTLPFAEPVPHEVESSEIKW